MGGPHPGVVAGGEAADAPLLRSPAQHRPKLHLPVATGAGQGGDAIAIALHQHLHNLLLKVLAKIHHMVGHPQLIAEGGGIHQPFGATGPLAAHQPEGEPLHLPAGIHQQGGGERAIDAAGEPDRNPVLARPGLQPLQGRQASRGGGGQRW